MSMPGQAESPEECGWTLGFTSGTRCTEPPADGKPPCTPHVQADHRIHEYAKDIRRRAERDLNCSYGGLAELRVLRDPRAIAERWWLATGVRYIPSAVRAEILDSGPCAYCGDVKPTEVDHIHPVSRGGLSERDNLAPACRRCNGEKLDQTVDEWRQWRVQNGLSWPPKTVTQLVWETLTRLLKTETPPFLADLLDMPTPIRRPAQFEDDPRWQAAHAALLGDRPDLDREPAHMRRIVAVEILYEIEAAYEQADGCASRPAAVRLRNLLGEADWAARYGGAR